MENEQHENTPLTSETTSDETQYVQTVHGINWFDKKYIFMGSSNNWIVPSSYLYVENILKKVTEPLHLIEKGVHIFWVFLVDIFSKILVENCISNQY